MCPQRSHSACTAAERSVDPSAVAQTLLAAGVAAAAGCVVVVDVAVVEELKTVAVAGCTAGPATLRTGSACPIVHPFLPRVHCVVRSAAAVALGCVCRELVHLAFEYEQTWVTEHAAVVHQQQVVCLHHLTGCFVGVQCRTSVHSAVARRIAVVVHQAVEENKVSA